MRSELTVPATIVFAGLIIAIAVFMVHHHTVVVQNGNPAAVNPVNPTIDHIEGNPNAPVVVIEYADVDSEYSKQFEQVMEQVIATEGTKGDVAWVYRHFPLIGSDVNADQHAEAAECVASLGGTSAFFKFIDGMQAAAPGDATFDPAGYDDLVSSLGLSTGSFDSCLGAHTYQKIVASDYNNALAVGATAVPFSVVLVHGSKPFTISGSLPYAAMEQVIQQSLSNAASAK